MLDTVGVYETSQYELVWFCYWLGAGEAYEDLEWHENADE